MTDLLAALLDKALETREDVEHDGIRIWVNDDGDGVCVSIPHDQLYAVDGETGEITGTYTPEWEGVRDVGRFRFFDAEGGQDEETWVYRLRA